MQTVGIKTLKNKLSEYIRAAAAGETVLVTDRGKVVAEITPPRTPPKPASEEQIMADLVRRGLVTPAKRPRAPLPPRQAPLISLDELLREIDEDRADR